MKQHLTKDQRHTIFVMIEQGKTKTEIAKIINKDKSVVQGKYNAIVIKEVKHTSMN